MRKNYMKAIVFALVVATTGITNISIVGTVQEVEAAERFHKVSDMNIKRTEKDEVLLTWKNIYSADGYEVYVKEGSGKWKKYKTANINMLYVNNLKSDMQYIFKVRAYRKTGKKKIYGEFSDKESIKLLDTIYLTDMFEPSGFHFSVDLYDKNSFMMYDVRCAKGFRTSLLSSSSGGSISYDINGDFSKMEFNWGTSQKGQRGNLMIYADDKIIYSEENNENEEMKTVTLDVTDVTKLTFLFTETLSVNTIERGYTGVGNIKLTYR